MSSVNKVIVLGRLGKDPEVRHFDNGGMVANFSLATSEKYKDKTTGEVKETTEWHNIVVWGKLAEVVGKYLKKGSQAYLEGRLRTRSWEKEGVTRYTTEIYADNLVMLGGKPQGAPAAPAPSAPSKGQPSTPTGGPDDDLPF